MSIRQGLANRAQAHRNPIYITYAIVSIFIFVSSMYVAKAGAGPLERHLFYFFNSMPQALDSFFIGISLFGSLGMVFVVALIALWKRQYATMFKVLLAGVGAYITAYALKGLDIRARPVEVIQNVIVREPSVGTHGFPSGHAAVATVLAILAYQYLPKRWHRPVTILAVLVMISRLYLGVHFPLDLVGGFAVGLFFGGVISFVIGSRRYSTVPPEKVKLKLEQLGFPITSVKLASVDARGSVPYLASGRTQNLFVKIVSLENTIADWLFKLTRLAMYRRLEDEQPFMSPKRQLEHEAYVAMLAYQAGVHTPKIAAVFEAQEGRWALAQELIPGKSLDSVDLKLITDKVLESIWKEVKKLHKHKIIHRDLRVANVFLDDNKQPWIIDFGFAEASIDKHSYYRDTVELVASLSLLVGIKRSVAAAEKIIGKEELKNSLPYLSYSSLSGATTKAMKQRKGHMTRLINALAKATGTKKVKTMRMKRLNVKMLLLILSLGIAFNVLAPQLVSFQESLDAAKQAQIHYVLLGVLLSSFTYLLAGFAYRFVAIYPLKLLPTIVIQIASSFTSKLAPAGTGGIALNARYLYKNNHDPVQAGAVTATNTILGLVSHISLVIIVALLTQESLTELIPAIHIPAFVFIVAALALASFAISLKFFPAFRNVFVKSRDKVFAQLSFYKSNLSKLAFCYITSVGITLCYATTLYVCALAFGVHLGILDVIYVFTVGTLVASITPTPGGIGGAEAAFIASLSSIGVDSGVAVTITLLYRLLTFWLPILPGFVAFRFASNKNYI